MSPATREYPEYPIPSVGVCVFKGDKVLLIQRGNQPSKGKWSVPGGAIELGETIQETAKREIAEECGIDIEPGKILTVSNHIVPDEEGRTQFHYTVIYLLADYVNGEARPGSDAVDVRWTESSEMDSLDMNPVVRDNMLEAFKDRSR
ncbi:NUDIX hydrolase [Chloroflexota bacterium]